MWTVQVIDVLSKMAGLWIDTNKTVLYSQATHITFICPMRKRHQLKPFKDDKYSVVVPIHKLVRQLPKLMIKNTTSGKLP